MSEIKWGMARQRTIPRKQLDGSILMTGKQKSNRKPFPKYYCFQCLKKWGWKVAPSNDICPTCNLPLRGGKKAIINGVVTRLLRQRGLKPPPSAKRQYENYLSTVGWKKIRERIWERDSWKCRVCQKPAEVVHHKSYAQDVLDGKQDDQLISLCHDCHTAIEFKIQNGRMVKNNLQYANDKLARMLSDATTQTKSSFTP